MGGVVKVGDYVYASGEKNRYWYCLDWKTGETKWKDNTVGVGSVIAAGIHQGVLYLRHGSSLMAYKVK